MDRCIIVSIHDVAPPFEREIDAILGRLNALGVSRCSLLVVPDYHHGGRADRDAAWADRLKRWQSAGHEMVLHGFYHQADDLETRGGLRNLFLRCFYTSGESEFLELDAQEAEKRLRLGMEVFANVGITTRGFIAPAWLMNDEVLKVIGKLGFDYTNTLKKIIDLKTGRVSDSWSQVYSSRAGWRRWASVGWNELLWRRNQGAEVVRVSIHPPENRYPMLWNHLESLVRRAAEGRKNLTYVDFVDRQRAGNA